MVEITNAQYAWIYEQTKGKDIILITVHGSHLYGLAGEGSDIDIKCIYSPSKQDLLMGRSMKTYNKKNDILDVEIEIKSLPSFLNSMASCDTNCIDLLHTPDSMIIMASDVWERIVELKHTIYSKNMRGIIGYIKTHTHKYSNKIKRFEEMTELLEMVNRIRNDGWSKVHSVAESRIFHERQFKYIKKVSMVSDHEQQYLEVCGKKYIYCWDNKLLINALETELARYGSRTLDGAQKGLDTKSLSHALRVLSELKEIITDRTVTFPLKERDIIMAVKNGAVDINDVLTDIDRRYDECMELLTDSDLPESTSITEITDMIEVYIFSDHTPSRECKLPNTLGFDISMCDNGDDGSVMIFGDSTAIALLDKEQRQEWANKLTTREE